ncbi:sulfite exporter TauE/SafE family protein [Paraburkholderia sediminicola]|uniref:sulfite exporter TauE/SafE family protein n=1 Tax=Paraburkholderia sediminicola TaxID=458836 RepID=UPI0038B8772E
MNVVDTPAVLGCLALVTLVAGMAKGLTGFGGALVMAPLFGLLMPVPEAGVLIVLIHFATSLQGVRTWASAARWRTVVPLALVAMACTAVTTRWMASESAVELRRLVAVAVLASTVMHMRGWRWLHNSGWRPTFTAGAMSGALTALGGIGGPPAVYYFNGIGKGSTLRANLLAYFALLYVGVVALFVAEHQVHTPQLSSLVLLVPVFVLGVAMGERLGPRLPVRRLEQLVSVLLLCSGLVALIT